MYEKRIASIQFLILHLMVPKISAGELERWSQAFSLEAEQELEPS